MAEKDHTPFVIGVVAPGRHLEPKMADEIEAAIGTFRRAEVEIRFHPQCFLSHGHFAGDDEARTNAFLDVANDPQIDAIWFARGGYGAGRLKERAITELSALAKAKRMLGYSDCGFLLGALYAAGCSNLAHGPVTADLMRPGGEAAIARALDFLVDGICTDAAPGAPSDAPRMTFNLTVLCHLLAAGRAPSLQGHVLLVEEVSEHLYEIDRTLGAIIRAAARDDALGLALGRCSDIPENDVDFAMTPEQIAMDWCSREGLSYFGRADIGHDAENKVVRFGRHSIPSS